MAAEPRTIKVAPGTALADLLATTGAEPVILDRDGNLYRLAAMNRKDDHPSSQEVARSKEAICRAAGGWKGLIDADAFKAYIHERRHTANRPSIKL